MRVKDKIECLILEDEYYTAFEIRRLLYAYDPAFFVPAMLESCVDFRAYMAGKSKPDLIVSDVDLADGSVFNLLTSLARPIPTILLGSVKRLNDGTFPNLLGWIYKPITAESLYAYLDLFVRENYKLKGKEESINI